MYTRYDETTYKASQILFCVFHMILVENGSYTPHKWLLFKMFNGFLTLRINLLTTYPFIMCIFAPKFKITR
jgi:hypothetical protein